MNEDKNFEEAKIEALIEMDFIQRIIQHIDHAKERQQFWKGTKTEQVWIGIERELQWVLDLLTGVESKSFLDEIVSEWQKFHQGNRNLPDEWLLGTGHSITHIKKIKELI